MSREFTPAAERALVEAARWTTAANSLAVEPPQLLLGLLIEPECRAALFLAEHGVDLVEVRRRWPELAVSESPDHVEPPRLASDVELALASAEARMSDFAQPRPLATEHLLLGLLASEGDVANWLAERGLETQRLEAEVRRIYGDRPDPTWVARPASSARTDRFHDHPQPRPAIQNQLSPAKSTSGEDVDRPNAIAACQPPEKALLTSGLDTEERRCRDRTDVLRAIDAAANRAREGLRTVEDYLRFIADDAFLTSRFKHVRHRLAQALACISLVERCGSRDTQADVGTGISTPREYTRCTPHDVAMANLQRLSEALRSLEEFGKLLSPELARAIEQIRYEAYTLERAVLLGAESSRRLDAVRLYVLVDGRQTPDDFRQLVKQIVAAGADAIQLRAKRLTDRVLLERAELLRQITREGGALSIVNDRPDVAVMSDSDGVHLGQDEPSVRDVRRVVGPRMLVGVSTHSLKQARVAVLDGANYIGVGPVFPSGTKQFEEFPGLPLVEAVAREIALPAFAIGGIDADNVAQITERGIRRVAVSSSVMRADRPGESARRLRSALDRGM